MNKHERALLEIMARAGEPMGWYQLERRLSYLLMPDRPFIGGVLDELVRRGLLAEMPGKIAPNVVYQLTAKGIEELGDVE